MKESGARIVEAEEAVREAEARHQKEVKKMQKQTERAIEEMTATQQRFVEEIQREHAEEIGRREYQY